jgi:hypothetical protein
MPMYVLTLVSSLFISRGTGNPTESVARRGEGTADRAAREPAAAGPGHRTEPAPQPRARHDNFLMALLRALGTGHA